MLLSSPVAKTAKYLFPKLQYSLRFSMNMKIF